MITDAEVERVPGATVYGADGEKIGKAGAVYRDDESGRPDWMTVQTGLFGSSETFVPLNDATFDGHDLRVPFDKARVKDAPRIDAEGHLDISEEDRLFEHYGMSSDHGSGDQGRTDPDAAGQRDAIADDRRDDRHHDRSDEGVTDRVKDRVEDRHSEGRDDRLRDADDRGAWTSGEGRADDEGPRHSAATPRSEYATDTAGTMDTADTDETGRRSTGEGSGVATAAAGAAGVGSMGLAAAAREGEGARFDGDGRDDERGETRQTQTADWRDESGARSASGLSSSPVSAGTSRGTSGDEGAPVGTDGPSDRRPRLSQWVLVERSSIIEVSPEEAERLAANRGSGTGTGTGTTETTAQR